MVGRRKSSLDARRFAKLATLFGISGSSSSALLADSRGDTAAGGDAATGSGTAASAFARTEARREKDCAGCMPSTDPASAPTKAPALSMGGGGGLLVSDERRWNPPDGIGGGSGNDSEGDNDEAGEGDNDDADDGEDDAGSPLSSVGIGGGGGGGGTEKPGGVPAEFFVPINQERNENQWMTEARVLSSEHSIRPAHQIQKKTFSRLTFLCNRGGWRSKRWSKRRRRRGWWNLC